MFEIPNNNVAFSPNPQSIVMSADLDALVRGLDGEGVIAGCEVSAHVLEDSGLITLSADATAGTFTRTAGSFLTDGFAANQQIRTSGFVNAGNNALKTISTVTATAITVTSSVGMVTETGSGDERVVREELVVDVAAGTVQVNGVAAVISAGEVVLLAAESDPRLDLIVADSTGALSSVKGTAAAISDISGPAAPAVPADRALLAMVFVQAGATAIIAAYLVDKRVPVVKQLAARSISVNSTARLGDLVTICTAALTLTLYPAANHLGGPVVVINNSAGNVVIDPDGAETINGQTTATLPSGGVMQLFPGTLKWFAW